MLPSLLAKEIIQGLQAYITTGFETSTSWFSGVFKELVEAPGRFYKDCPVVLFKHTPDNILIDVYSECFVDLLAIRGQPNRVLSTNVQASTAGPS